MILRKPYTKEEIQFAVKNSKSFSDVFRNLNLKINGGAFVWMKKLISKFEIDISHFMTKCEMMKIMGAIGNDNTKRKIYESGDISNGERLSAGTLRSFMFYHEKTYICACCNNSEWMGNPLRLDVDHVDGNSINNKIDNLQFLCPNCHRQKTIPIQKLSINKKENKFRLATQVSTEKIKKTSLCIDCGKKITEEAKQCVSCSKKGTFKIDWPSDKELKTMLWEKPTCDIGEILGVSDSAIGKRCRIRNIEKPPRGYWQKLMKNLN